MKSTTLKDAEEVMKQKYTCPSIIHTYSGFMGLYTGQQCSVVRPRKLNADAYTLF